MPTTLRSIAGLLLVATAAAAAGCSDNDQSRAPTTPLSLVPNPSSASQSATPSGSPKNGQGRIVKQPGQTAGVADPNTGEDWFTFALSNIRAAPDCQSGSDTETPKRGEFVFADVSFTTSKDYATAQYNGRSVKGMLDGMMNPFNFRSIRPDGTVAGQVDAAYMCDANSTSGFSDGYDPASSYRGTYVFDVEKGTKALIFNPGDSATSWQWDLP